MENEDNLFNYKIVVVGESDTGKTNLINRFVLGRYDDQLYHTYSSNFLTKKIPLYDDINITTNIWDTVGGERYRSLLRIFMRFSQGIIIVYDISRKYTFESVRYYLDLINQIAPNIVVALVGNKVDIEFEYDSYYEREVTTEEGQKFAEDHNLLFYETSGKNGTNVNEFFNDFIQRIFQNDPEIQQIIATTNLNNTKNNERPPKRGCLK